MKTVYLARHGQAQVNAEGKLAGSRSESDLTAVGEQQARDLAVQLKDVGIDLIVTSPMSRARQTAEIVAKELGYSGEIVEQPLFIERDFGSATDLPKAEAIELLDTNQATDVEPLQTLYEHVTQALEWLGQQPAHNVLVITHGTPVDMIRTIHKGGDPEKCYEIGPLQNGEVYKFSL